VERLRRILLVVLLLGVMASVAGSTTFSAFSSTTANSGNAFTAGTVVLSDNDAGASMLTLSNAKPGDTATGCIRVSYTGSLAANVHLYASVSSSLAPYLQVTVTRGTDSSPSFASCTNFTADGTNYNGNGAGVIYSGLLSAFPSTYAAGVVDPSNCGSPPCSAQTWSSGNAHSYKFVVSLNNDNNAQGLSSTATFTWEAQNT
jgi:hypothetical protein